MKKPIILSAGGTGGHMVPAAALAAELIKRGWPVIVASDRRGGRYKKVFGDLPFHELTVCEPPKGRLGTLRCLALMAAGMFQAFLLIRKTKPAAVVGFGGNPSAPAMLVARLLNVPTIIHEQNAVFGKANRLLAEFAKKIAISYAATRNLPEKFKARIIVTGPLIRADIAALHDLPYPPLTADGTVRIFIMGGSQGARVLGTVIPAALAGLPAPLRVRLSVVQQCRTEELDRARMVYADAGITARLAPFIDDVPAQLAQCHLFIGRAGGTVAEVTAAGRPAIFIPYPHHADQQQKINAEAVAKTGGAWVMTEDALTPDLLATQLMALLRDPAILTKAASASRACGRPDAAGKLADLVLSLSS